MSDPVIVDMLRTPFGKRGGWISPIHSAALLGMVQCGVIERIGIAPELVEEVVGGCVTPLGEQYGHITRTSWLYAGLPPQTGATTIDAQCSTAQRAVQLVAGQIALGAMDMGLACGVEVMSRAPLTAKAGTGLGTPRPADWAVESPDQYTGAERIAAHRGFSRADVDAFGLRSQQRARAAWDAGRFDREILPVTVPTEDGGTTVVTRDQGLRETSMEALAKLTPVKEGGIHTAGTSSQVSDGASAALLMSAQRAGELGVKPRARLRAQTIVGGDLTYLLDGPIEAGRKVMSKLGMSVSDIDLFEVNEAFASVPMSFARVHGVPDDKLNVGGGAIALGHPAGATGIRLLATATNELERQDKSIALVAICASASTTAVIIERL
ncbi:steroid 3-ketoacyl-CoA thiolase [Tomitella gaofuii]|uniref:steroid 3-ketoacyl-CoA thiolase n=1 Tax=Tomitella gaofuii TaxID=2760083 RepID=UPI0015F97460|nr:steroid 3-ketoacyl-CoA thiolase [Tomitella gaofuii]